MHKAPQTFDMARPHPQPGFKAGLCLSYVAQLLVSIDFPDNFKMINLPELRGGGRDLVFLSFHVRCLGSMKQNIDSMVWNKMQTGVGCLNLATFK